MGRRFRLRVAAFALALGSAGGAWARDADRSPPCNSFCRSWMGWDKEEEAPPAPAQASEPLTLTPPDPSTPLEPVAGPKVRERVRRAVRRHRPAPARALAGPPASPSPPAAAPAKSTAAVKAVAAPGRSEGAGEPAALPLPAPPTGRSEGAAQPVLEGAGPSPRPPVVNGPATPPAAVPAAATPPSDEERKAIRDELRQLGGSE